MTSWTALEVTNGLSLDSLLASPHQEGHQEGPGVGSVAQLQPHSLSLLQSILCLICMPDSKRKPPLTSPLCFWALRGLEPWLKRKKEERTENQEVRKSQQMEREVAGVLRSLGGRWKGRWEKPSSTHYRPPHPLLHQRSPRMLNSSFGCLWCTYGGR